MSDLPEQAPDIEPSPYVLDRAEAEAVVREVLGSADMAEQAEGGNVSDKLPKWPRYASADGTAPYRSAEVYERARAEAAIARLRVAVDELNALREDDCHWYTSALEFQNMDGLKRLASLETALALIGPLPKE